ncbi:MAG: GGDEF domain-containing protein [Acidobacteria bacterium]|nr:MAG: GGDEF domain-containing protein [Acidobacteriota bacterium]
MLTGMTSRSSPWIATVEGLRRGVARRRRWLPPAQAWAPRLLLALQLVAAAWIVLVLELPEPVPALLGLLLCLAAAAAGTLRLGERGHLGLAAAFLPALAAIAGVLGAAILAALASAISDRVVLLLEGRFPDAPPERRLPRRRLHDVLNVAVAASAAGWVAMRPIDPAAALAAAAAVLAAALLLHETIARSSHREGARLPRGPLADGACFLLGGLIWLGLGGGAAVASDEAAPPAAALRDSLLAGFGLVVLVGLVAGLALALSAQQRLTAHLTTRLSVLDAIGSAPRRLGSPGRRQLDLVESAIEEIGRLIDFDYLQLDLAGPAPGVWSARRGHPPRSSPAAPPRHPPPRPGIHRRREWIRASRVLESGDTLLGTLHLWCDPRRQDSRGLEVLDHLGEQVSALLERSILAREARFDRLTGLPRRAIFDDEIERRWRDARELGEPLAVVLLDVDHFKSVNDRYGHQVGDRALLHVANLLAQAMREEDLCCRYGGEEFVLLLTAADGSAALEMAERARRAVAASPLPIADVGQVAAPGPAPLRLTISCGCASVPEVLLRGPSDLVGMADEALYAAKASGRDRSLLAVGGGRFRSPGGKLVDPGAPSADSGAEAASAEDPGTPGESRGESQAESQGEKPAAPSQVPLL